MKLYNHLQLSHAKTIITLANKGISRYKIWQITGIFKGKIRRCLNSCEKIIRTRNIREPWKHFRIKRKYSFLIYKNQRDQSKLNRAYNYASTAEQLYLTFVNFCNNLFNKKILNKKVKRSANEYIKEFKKAFPEQPYPKKSWVYHMAKSSHYQFSLKWLPVSRYEKSHFKSDDERKKPENIFRLNLDLQKKN